MLFEPGLPTQPVAFSHDPPVDDRLTLVVVAGPLLSPAGRRPTRVCGAPFFRQLWVRCAGTTRPTARGSILSWKRPWGV